MVQTWKQFYNIYCGVSQQSICDGSEDKNIGIFIAQ